MIEKGNVALTAPSSNPTAVDARPAVSTGAGRGRRLARGTNTNRNHLRKLRERFVADPANTDLTSLRPVIERSWRRSLLWNIDPGRSSFEQVNEPHMDELVLRCAEPVLAELQTMATDTGASVFLADPSGTITAFRGDPDVRRVTEKVFPTFGGAMSEDVAGTNAEGTAIEEGEAVQIWGSEHFVTSLQQFYCTSVPIRDPLRRSVRGFLSLALPESVGIDVDPASVAMITKGAAAEVTRLLAEGLALREKSLLDSYIAEVRKRGGEAVVVMDSRTTIASRGALETLQPSDYAVLAGYAHESEQLSRPVEHEVMLGTQRMLHLRASPIQAAGETIGSVIRLKPVVQASSARRGTMPKGRSDPFKTVIGESHALRRVVDVASTAVRRRLPAYLTGEPGSGKLRLAEAMASMMATHRVTLDGRAAGWNDHRLTDVESALHSGAAVVLAHAEALPSQARLGLTELLVTHDSPPVILTLSDVDDKLMELIAALSGMEIEMPALRQRRDDIPLLVTHFLASAKQGVDRISRSLLRALTEADWPGNIAQLQDFVESAVARCGSSELGMEHLSDTHRKALARSRLSRLEEVELQQIREALAEADGNRLRAAKLLQIGRSTLYRKIETYTRRGFTVGG